MFELEDEEDEFWEKLPLDEFKDEWQMDHVTRDENQKLKVSPNTLLSGAIQDQASSDRLLAPIHTNSINSKQTSSDRLLAPIHTNSINSKQTSSDRLLSPIHTNSINSKQTSSDRLLAPIHTNSINSKQTSSDRLLAPIHTNSINSKQTPSDRLLAPIHTNSINSKDTEDSSKKVSKSGLKRKFPGPAGILPKSFSNDSSEGYLEETDLTRDDTDIELQDLPPSQPSSSCDVFSSKSWLSLIADIGPDASSVIAKFSIKSMIFKASKRILPKRKIPLVLAVVDSVDFHGCDGSVVLHDPSGKVHGALHQDLIRDPLTALQAGCVLVLRQTSVISPSPRNHYLNITPANIVLIYSQGPDFSVQKSPWGSPSRFVTPASVPTISQLVQDSEVELTSALADLSHHQQETRHKQSVTSPGPSLWQTISTNPRLSGLPTPNGTRSSFIPQRANTSTHPYLTLQRHPVRSNMKSPSTSLQSGFSSPVSSTLPGHNQINHDPRALHGQNNSSLVSYTPSSSQTHHSQHPTNHTHRSTNHAPGPTSHAPHPTNHTPHPTSHTPHSTSHTYLPTSLKHYTKNQHTPQPSNLERVKPQTQEEEFPEDDDSDLLSIWDDGVDLSNTDATSSEDALTKIQTRDGINRVENDARSNKSHPCTSGHFINAKSSIRNPVEISPPSTTESASYNIEMRQFSMTHKSTACVSRSLSSSQSVGNGADNFKIGNYEWRHNAGLPESFANESNNGGDVTTASRDARIQLGRPGTTRTMPVAFGTNNYGTWDDDLSDDLLSQL